MAFTLNYQNLREIRTKSDIFSTNVLNVRADLVAVTETWLNGHFFDSEFTDGRYNVFRKDRPYESTGGCLALVKKKHSS